MSEGMGDSIGSLMFICIITLLSLQLIFPSLLKKMWPLYNVLQIICIITIMDLKTPPNANLVLAEIKEGIELNFIPLHSLLAMVPED